MIQDTVKLADVQSTLQGETVALTIAQEAMVHIMQQLTDLYSDPEMAIIREYSTNAYDAHIEAGIDKPIEVFLPGPLSPVLRIKDHGVGLSVEDIHEIYSRYGASTKRGTNDQVGMLGFGCKSGLAYAQQFTLTSVKDGTSVTVCVSRDEEGAGGMQIVDTRSTDEPNGTEVMIPVRPHNAIERKAKHFFSFWPEDRVLIDGLPPKPFQYKFQLGDAEIYAVNRMESTIGESYIVMGGVPYPFHLDNYELKLPYWLEVVAFVPIGAIDFTPSREELRMSDKTKACIDRITADLRKRLMAEIQKVIDAAATPVEALTVAWEQGGLVGKAPDQFTYNGAAMPNKFPVPDSDNPLLTAPFHSDKMSKTYTERNITSNPTVSVWVVNFDRETFTATMKKKLKKWAETCGYDFQQFILTKDSKPLSPEWVDPARIVDWKAVEAIKIPRAVTSTTTGMQVPVGTYEAYVEGKTNWNITADEIEDLDLPIFYAVNNYNSTRRLADKLSLTDCVVVVALSTNRVNKFLRLFPNAKLLDDLIADRTKAFLDGLTDAQRQALIIQEESWQYDDVMKLDAAQVDDPDLKAQINLSKMDLTPILNEYKILNNVTCLDLGDHPENVMSKYPLLSRMRYYEECALEHAYIYINAVYAKEATS